MPTRGAWSCSCLVGLALHVAACGPNDNPPSVSSAGSASAPLPASLGGASGSPNDGAAGNGGSSPLPEPSLAGSGGLSVGATSGAGGASGAGGTIDDRLALPNPLDPAATDPDFSIQGEYLGTVQAGGEELVLGAQIIALGNAEFRAVFEPGGLPGEGSSGVKIDVNGKRDGAVASFGPDIQAREVETGGQPGNYTASVTQGLLTGSDDQGRAFTLQRVLRESPTLGRKPPQGAIVLFDGTGTQELIQGEPNDYPTTYFPGEGGMTADGLLKEGATTVRKFGDCALHVEFRVPFAPELDPNYRGNSGVYLQGAYEVNILDSLGLPGKEKDNGVIWGVRDPDVNMSFPPLSWQTFDIDFVAARWNGEQKVSSAKMTVRVNGVRVHDSVELPGATTHNPLPEANQPGPIFLQSNPFPVRFRYIWVLEK